MATATIVADSPVGRAARLVPFTVTAQPPPPGAKIVVFSDVQLGAPALWVTRATATATMLRALNPDWFMNLGDEVNDSAVAAYWTAYDKIWGGTKSKIKPVKGSNTHVPLAKWQSYYGISGNSYYSYDVAGWHILSINYNLPMAPGSEQYNWAQSDLAAHTRVPTIAMWHAPRFSAGSRHPGGASNEAALFSLLIGHGVELLVCGHDHVYERYPRVNASGKPDNINGVMCINVANAGQAYSNTESGANKPVVWGTGQECGGLLLTLSKTSFSWQWKSTPGYPQVTDSGSQAVRYPLK